MVLVLSEGDLRRIALMDEVVDSIERAFLALSKGRCKVPLRSIVEVGGDNYVLYMPAYVEPLEALSVKVVSVFPGNVERGLPVINAIVVLTDPGTGVPLAIMEGGYLTALRTGATSGVALKYLAREDSRVLGVIGTGRQAYFQVWAAMTVRNIELVKAYDLRREAAERFKKEVEGWLGLPVELVGGAREAVKGSDIVVLATTSKSPVISGGWLEPGITVVSIGWMGRDARELDTETVLVSKLVVDMREAVLAESGDILIPLREGVITEDHIYAELSEIVSGRKPGRVSSDEKILFKSVGLAIEDAAAAKLLYEKAIKAGVGREITLA